MNTNLKDQLPFRLGTTSYIIPADILPNAHFLADKVKDIQLVLFEVDDGPNNLPGEDVLKGLKALKEEHDLSYTVHMPLDLRLGSDGSVQHESLAKARRVLDCTLSLDPWVYVVHLDGSEVEDGMSGFDLAHWQEQAARALEVLVAWTGDPGMLAVENLERYPPDYIHPVVKATGTGYCVDFGHFWVRDEDPIIYLDQVFEHTKMMHLHGIAERDHKSLQHVAPRDLDPLLAYLIAHNYTGVLTLEIFSEADLESSFTAMEESLNRIDYHHDKGAFNG